MGSEIKKEVKGKGKIGDDQFTELAVLRVKNLLANPDISQSQKKVLYNILKKLGQ